MVEIILFILAISLLVIIHEWGHFFVAKKLKMEVEEFGIGFFYRIFAIKRGETTFSLNLIPLGGFVKIRGEGNDPHEKNSFYNRPILHRAFVIGAGVIMNFLVFIFLFTIVLMLGMPAPINGPTDEYVRDRGVYVMNFYNSTNSLQESDLQIWDRITHLSTQDESVIIYSLADVHHFLNMVAPDQPISVSFVRNNKEHITVLDYSDLQSDILIKTVAFSHDSKMREQEVLAYSQQGTLEIFYHTPDGSIVPVAPTAEALSQLPQGVNLEGSVYQGNVLENGGVVSFSFFSSLWRAVISSVSGSVAIAKGLGESVWGLVTAGDFPDQVAGPVGVVNFVQGFEGSSIVLYLQFLAIISLNLAVLNTLPFPALDGGRLLFLAIEGIRGFPVSLKTEWRAEMAGIMTLACLIVFISVKELADIIF